MAARATTKPIAGTFFYILLALVDRPRYGLGIVKEVAERTAGEILLGPGTLYNAIRKMQEGDLIEEWTPPDEPTTDPRRRYYRITPHGRAVVAEEAGRLEQLVVAARAKQVLPGT